MTADVKRDVRASVVSMFSDHAAPTLGIEQDILRMLAEVTGSAEA